MKSDQDYYEVLGVTPSASAQKITKAYRRLALQYHPDINRASEEANYKMREINEAYATLSNPIKRRVYDIPRGYFNIVPKFKKGSKVRVSFNSASPYRDHTGVVDKEPLMDTFRFWYIVKFKSKGFTSGNRFAEEELEQVSD